VVLTGRDVQLSALLEADVGLSTAKPDTGRLQNGIEPADIGISSSDYMQRSKESFVSFRVFQEAYWPHFAQPLTKGLGEVSAYSCVCTAEPL